MSSDVLDKIVSEATKYLRSNFEPGRHHIAAALVTDARIYLALHLDTKGFDVCAEPIALSNALSEEDTDFKYIVAVARDGGGSIGVVSPCGNCRQILLEYAPHIRVITNEGGSLMTHSVTELLPYPY